MGFAHRELLGGLARTAWETVLELMCEAAGDKVVRPGIVNVVQTAGDLANWHPHVHALVSRGGWTQNGEWIPIAFVDKAGPQNTPIERISGVCGAGSRGSLARYFRGA